MLFHRYLLVVHISIYYVNSSHIHTYIDTHIQTKYLNESVGEQTECRDISKLAL